VTFFSYAVIGVVPDPDNGLRTPWIGIRDEPDYLILRDLSKS
jgi:hypothetical protein